MSVQWTDNLLKINPEISCTEPRKYACNAMHVGACVSTWLMNMGPFDKLFLKEIQLTRLASSAYRNMDLTGLQALDSTATSLLRVVPALVLALTACKAHMYQQHVPYIPSCLVGQTQMSL